MFWRKWKEKKSQTDRYIETQEGRFIFPLGTDLRKIDARQLAATLCSQTGHIVLVNVRENGLEINGYFYPYNEKQ